MNALLRIFYFIFATTFLLCRYDFSEASGEGKDVYLVKEIKVDVTAQTAALARKLAIAKAHNQAFRKLLNRIALIREIKLIGSFPQKEIYPLVLSFGIDEERASSVRYIAKMQFQFRRDSVRRYLATRGLSFTETRSKPVLLLPVYENTGAKILWDKPNPWFSAWRRVPFQGGLVPILLPKGVLADVRLVSANQAAAASLKNLNALAKRYNVASIVVAIATINTDITKGLRTINVTTNYFGGSLSNRTSVRSFRINEGVKNIVFLSNVAEKIASQVSEDWKNENVIRLDQVNELLGDIEIPDLAGWIDIQKKLRKTSLIKNVRILGVSRRKALIRLTFYGRPRQLQTALGQLDLVLKRGSVNWIITELNRKNLGLGSSSELERFEN